MLVYEIFAFLEESNWRTWDICLGSLYVSTVRVEAVFAMLKSGRG
ncbi:hypothetical protein ACB092_02G032800 [Castanea dentata]